MSEITQGHVWCTTHQKWEVAYLHVTPGYEGRACPICKDVFEVPLVPPTAAMCPCNNCLKDIVIP